VMSESPKAAHMPPKNQAGPGTTVELTAEDPALRHFYSRGCPVQVPRRRGAACETGYSTLGGVFEAWAPRTRRQSGVFSGLFIIFSQMTRFLALAVFKPR
jgi:hypothetical protein